MFSDEGTWYILCILIIDRHRGVVSRNIYSCNILVGRYNQKVIVKHECRDTVALQTSNHALYTNGRVET